MRISASEPGIGQALPTPGGSLARNFAFLIGAHALSKSMTLLALFLLARYLGDAAFGRYVVALALPMLFEAVGDFGISQVLVREGAGHPERVRHDVVSVLPFKLLLGLTTVVTSFLLAIVLALPGEIVEATVYLAIAKAIESLNFLSLSVFEAHERMEYEGASLVLDSVVRLVFVVYAVVSGFGVVGLTKSLVLGAVVVFVSTSIVALHRFLGRIVPWPDLRRGTMLLSAGVPFAAVWLFEGMALRFDTVLVGRVAGEEAAGIFGAALRLIEPMLVVPIMMSVAVLPVIARHVMERRNTIPDLLAGTEKLSLLIALAVALFLLGAAPPVVVLVYGEEFAEASVPLRILALAAIPLFLRPTLARFLLAVHRTRSMLVSQVTGLAVNLTFAIVLIPRYAAAGGAVAVVAGEYVTIAIALAIVRGLGTLRLRELLVAIVPAIPASLALVAIQPAGDLPATGLALAVLLVSVRLLRVFRETEIEYIASTIPVVGAVSRLLLAPIRWH